MRNIKFIGRGKEQKLLQKYAQKSFFIVVKGRRRIGKTRLLKETFPKAKYFFVWPNKSINWITKEFCAQFSLPEFSSFKDAFEYLLEKGDTIILDEFQNFLNIDKSFYGELQEIIDRFKFSNKKYKIVVSGSSYSLLNKVFEDAKSPLYGRRSYQMFLKGIDFKYLKEIIPKSNIEKEIMYSSVFDGVPYYYELLNKDNSYEENILELFLSKEGTLYDEGNTIVSLEFANNTKTYATIISAIANGKTTFGELSAYFSSKSELIKYLDLLRNKYNLIRREVPILSNSKKSKEGIYLINDQTLDFWNLFIDKQRIYYEIDEMKKVESFFKQNIRAFIGRQFERLILNFFKDGCFGDYDRVGSQWGKYRENTEIKTYEIDICAINEIEKKILFGEVKWKENVSARKVLDQLKSKTDYVLWNNDTRKEEFVIFAKSFKEKKEEILNLLKNYNCKCYDLSEIEKILENRE